MNRLEPIDFAIQNAFDQFESDLLVERDLGARKTVVSNLSSIRNTLFILPRPPPRHRLLGLPLKLLFARPRFCVSGITAWSTRPQANLLLGSPDCSSHLCIGKLRKKKMSLTGLCNRLIFMSTHNVVQFLSFRLTPFRPMFCSPLRQTTPMCSRRTEARHTGVKPPLTMRTPKTTNSTPSHGRLGSPPLTATLTPLAKPSQARRPSLLNAPWQHYPSTHGAAERRRWYPLSCCSLNRLLLPLVRRRSVGFTRPSRSTRARSTWPRANAAVFRTRSTFRR